MCQRFSNWGSLLLLWFAKKESYAGRYALKLSRKSAKNEYFKANGLAMRVLMLAILIAVLLLFILSVRVQTMMLSFLFPSERQYTHSRKTLLVMTGEHIALTLLATVLSSFVGILIGIGVTRKGGKDFQVLILRLNAFIQTFPPSAVIILAYPVLEIGRASCRERV